MRLFHSWREIGQAETASLLIRLDRAMYSCCRPRMAAVSVESWKRMLFSYSAAVVRGLYRPSESSQDCGHRTIA
jgi:hypothetical protein